MEKVALVIGGTVLLFGGVILAVAIIGLLIYFAEAIWVVADDDYCSFGERRTDERKAD